MNEYQLGFKAYMLEKTAAEEEEKKKKRTAGDKTLRAAAELLIGTPMLGIAGGIAGAAIGKALPVKKSILPFGNKSSVTKNWNMARGAAIGSAVGHTYGLKRTYDAATED